jgi:tyrosine-protein phosphatase YwqE
MPFTFLSARGAEPVILSTTDIHSHLLPGIDDGVTDLDEALEVIKGFANLGYRKLITTPHIMADFYKNTPEIIKDKLKLVQNALSEQQINIELQAAAEYYLDEHFLTLIEADSPLLTFGKNYVLFETSFISKPLYLKEVIFKLQTNGYSPVLAHPERYLYLHDDKTLLQEIYDSGVLLQLNLSSIDGYYSKQVRNMARYLINNKMISLFGSDCHNSRQLIAFEHALKNNFMDSLRENTLLNNKL